MAVSLLFLGPARSSGLAVFSVCRESVVGLSECIYYIYQCLLRAGIRYVQFVLEMI
jgi:hypothetical protein